MRLQKRLQLFLRPAKVTCDRSQELEEMGRILDSVQELNEVYRQILHDINGANERATGREGLTAEQVLKLGLKRIFGWSRVLDRSKETFASAVHLAGLAYNLTLLARINLAKQPCG